MRFIIPCLLLSFSAFAQNRDSIYPHVPYGDSEILEKVSRMAEEEKPLINVFEMNRLNLMTAKPAQQPWGGSFWPLIQGQIGNRWQKKNYLEFWEMALWRNNVNNFKKNDVKDLRDFDKLNEEELAELAPSEKYDILIGDKSFQLTHNVWNFIERWGEEKKWGFLSSIDLPAGYRIPKANKLMAFWEGICHGWAVAAGTYPRPAKTVTITLPDGRKMPFFPHDIKALVSLYYANSVLQDNVLMEGYRCNEKNPTKDQFGRHIDELPKKEGEAHLPRCADVHPAVWHLGMVNITGIQKRSMIVEIDADAPINNFPFSGYEFKWFNPSTGKTDILEKSVVNLDSFNDPYKANRHPRAKRLVGVETKILYTAWVRPKGTENDSIDKDEIKDQKFMYDLELDEQGNVVGGQWRADKVVRSYNDEQSKPTIKHPDFFWVAPKNVGQYLRPLNLEAWSGTTPTPASWLPAAQAATNFVYNVTQEFGFREKCTVIPLRGRGSKEVDCEFKYPRPQPLVNVIDKLVELSK